MLYLDIQNKEYNEKQYQEVTRITIKYDQLKLNNATETQENRIKTTKITTQT